MKRFVNMLRGNRGESLIETIVSFLVIAVALLAFSTFALAGFNLNSATTQQDSNTGSAMTSSASGSVSIDGANKGSITIHGNDGGVYSYEKAAG